MQRSHAGTLSTEDVGRRVRLQAWVHRRRDLGGLFFLELRDRTGRVQVLVHPEDQAEAHAILDPVRSEWVVEVEGEVSRRLPKNVNPDMATGEIEVLVDQAKILSPSEALPFQLDGHIEASEELRLRHRYLELRRPDLQRNFLLRDKVSLETRQYLHEQGFLDLETPILTRSTPEGARDYLVPSRVHPGRFYALPQSPQLFKQILMVSGFERYYQVARCFRDEDLRADRQPEFTQIDLEMSFVDEEQVIELIEGLFARIFRLIDVEIETPFPRLPYAEAMARYGSDKPDLRFGLEIVDLTSELGQSGFRGFKAAAESGGVIRGFRIPGAASASRKMLDGWIKLAQQHGAAGVLTLRHRDGELQFQIKKALSEAEVAAAASALALEDGDLALLAAGPADTTAAALGALRLELAKHFELIPEGQNAFLWVTEFPLFERDEEAERWVSLHHPFTSPDARDLDQLASDPSTVRSRAYDVVLNGFELGGGSIRIHQQDLQQQVFGLLGIDPDEAESRFGFLLDALKYGAPPHGGIALGLDRIVMLMSGAQSLREVILFPKTTSATCLMTEAPSDVDPAQLEELGIGILEKASAEAKGETEGE